MIPMKIEIATLGRMTQTGSSLITLYQDKHTPVLDLLVREAVQNSLDAGNFTNQHAENKKYVEVSFLTGSFCPKEFNATLEGVEESMNYKYGESQARYLAIKDKYTAGLTGPLNINEVRDYKYGNLIKLVYDICKPQENEGAGGSWGIGKTIYFRLGKGFVVYYSRIFNETDGEFQSRLAVSLVEDEHSPDAIIPKYKGKNNTGIAWWGHQVEENMTQPITDEGEINKFLDIFNISPYQDKETGTIVLIPYVDEKALLANNRFTDSESEDSAIPEWQTSIDDYLNVAIQRWYFPRLCNIHYKYGKYLKAYINGRLIKSEEILPVFRLGQALYNCSISSSTDIEKDFCIDNDLTIHTNKITVKKHFINDTCSGSVSFAEVDKEYMEMCPPNNFYSPYNYIDVDKTDADSNPPIFTFCRKPGLAVSYKGNEEWLRNVPSSEKGMFIMALFALNSENKLAGVDYDLEEYVRKSEMANHNSWEDYPLESKTRDIINKIKRGTARTLCKAFQVNETPTEEKRNTGFGTKLASLILPRTGFGRKGKTKNQVPQRKKEYSVHKDISLALLDEEIVYMGDSIEVTYSIKSNKETNSIILNNYISTEASPIHPEEWEENGLSLPYDIEKALIRIQEIDKNDHPMVYKLEKNGNIVDDLADCVWNKTPNGNDYGITFRFSQPHHFEMTISFVIRIISRDIKTIFKPE